MVFKRRKPLSTVRQVREFIYPSSGWRRAIEYFGHRLKRLPDTPHKIALGFACGVFVSFSPLFGLHFIYAGILALIVRGNLLASFLGTLFGNPLTFPFIAGTALGLGRKIMGAARSGESMHSLREGFAGATSGLWQSTKAMFGFGEPAWQPLGTFFWEVFVPYFVGGILPGLATATAMYFLTRPLVAAYQARRRKRLFERAQQRIASAAPARKRLIEEGGR
ncbi:DUF2062 domain-containing protein [Halovulum marinum]|uniref:DUF2062 domain-containing protein n=1 Tax=Halovulum marinum TaxID=2662447 RepID=UPI0012B212D5|nr:DUF2062 domain-containing protein [Halovulum marinum]